MSSNYIIGCACIMAVGLSAACLPAIICPSDDYINYSLGLVTTSETTTTETTTEIITTSDVVTTTSEVPESLPEGAEEDEEDSEEVS